MHAALNTRLAAVLLLLFVPAAPSAAFQADSSTADNGAKKILRHLDELYRSNSSYSTVEMKIVTPHWERTLDMNIWTREMDHTFIRITSPEKERGVATLRVGNEMWNYLPKVNKVMKIPPSMMMSSWMGSDFTNDDLVDEFTYEEDYHSRLIQPEEAVDSLVYVECIPREDLPVVWGKIVIALRSSDWLPVWERYYDEKDELMRIFTFSEIRRFGNRTLPAVMEVIPQNKEGHKTTIRYEQLEFDTGVDDDIFTLRNLRSR